MNVLSGIILFIAGIFFIVNYMLTTAGRDDLVYKVFELEAKLKECQKDRRNK